MTGLSNTLGLVGDRPAEEILRRLTLDVTTRLDGVLHGDFMGLVPGRGSEPGETRRYEAGDDVRRIDWNVTARTQYPHIRETIADRELEAWLLLDRSSRLDFGTATCEKRDLVLAAGAGIGLLVAKGGNRVGAVMLRGSETETVPPRSGRKHLLGLMSKVMNTPREDGSGAADLAAGMAEVESVARRRGLVTVISDFATPVEEWKSRLGTLAQRHTVLCAQVLDPRDLELPKVGHLRFVDPATGSVREVNTDKTAIRENYARLAAEQQTAIDSAIRGDGADHLVLRTDEDWLMALAKHVSKRRHHAGLAAGIPK